MQWKWVVGLTCGVLIACGGEAEPVCADYVDCQRAYDEAFGIAVATEVSDYDDGGRCWGSEQTRQLCRDQCTVALGELRRALDIAERSLPSCQP